MAKPLPVAIPATQDIETLRKHVVVRLNSLSLRIAQQDNRTAPMSMGGNRLTDVPDPANALDAVNLRTLKKELQGIGQTHNKPTIGEHYTIVWSISGVATGTAPPYIVNPFRNGVPGFVKAYAITTGTASTAMNIYYVPGGTIASAVKLLPSDIILGSGINGPVT